MNRSGTNVWKPSRLEIAAAHGMKVRDVIAPRLQILFCGINPGLYSGAVGHHFARPGNRFWPALYAAGFTDHLLSPFEERELLKLRLGITNIADRSTAGAAELTVEELRSGAQRLKRKIRKFRPRWVAFLGITAYRIAFDRKKAVLGQQEGRLGTAGVWILPNPSGLNAHFQLAQLAGAFRDLRRAIS